MAFIVGGLIIGGVANVAGAAISSRGAKKSAEIAAQGASEEIAFNRESRDLARGDQEPYKQAGSKALNRLMELTGLDGASPAPGTTTVSGAPVTGTPTDSREVVDGQLTHGERFNVAYDPNRGAYTATRKDTGETAYVQKGNVWRPAGGPNSGGARNMQRGNAVEWGGVFGRAHGGPLYNVNELGPEDIYSHGAITRHSEPKTIPPDESGYVAPNIQGRALGGLLRGPQRGAINYWYSGPRPNRGVQLAEDTGKYGQQGYRNPAIPDKQNYTAQGSPSQTPGVVNPGETSQSWTMGDVLRSSGYPVSSEGAMQRAGDIGAPATVDGATGQVADDPYGDSSISDDPSYRWRFDEGMRALDRSAAARGGLLSGGFARKAIRYGQDYASTEYQNIYNRISNIAGLGQVSSQQSGNAALYSGAAMGRAAGDRGVTAASGYQGQYNAWANAANQVAQMPWGQVFNRGGGSNYYYDNAPTGYT